MKVAGLVANRRRLTGHTAASGAADKIQADGVQRLLAVIQRSEMEAATLACSRCAAWGRWQPLRRSLVAHSSEPVRQILEPIKRLGTMFKLGKQRRCRNRFQLGGATARPARRSTAPTLRAGRGVGTLVHAPYVDLQGKGILEFARALGAFRHDGVLCRCATHRLVPQLGSQVKRLRGCTWQGRSSFTIDPELSLDVLIADVAGR